MIKLTRLATVTMLVCACLTSTSDTLSQTRKGGTRTTAKTTATATKTIDLNGNFYEGLIKMPGQPMDVFGSLSLSTSDATLNFPGAAEFAGTYKATETAGKMAVNLTSEYFNGILASQDKGSSLDGTLKMNGQQLKVWFVKVNPNHSVPELGDSELATIIGNPDGYTAFIIGEQGGQKACFPADMILNGADNTFAMTFDNATVQRIFSNLQGQYTVTDKQLEIITDSKGIKLSGKIYDDGTYISIPMGSKEGIKFTMLLIR